MRPYKHPYRNHPDNQPKAIAIAATRTNRVLQVALQLGLASILYALTLWVAGIV